MTLVELMMAVFVLTVGLLGLAQLFVMATMNNALSVNTSEGLIDAQRCLEAYGSIAATSPSGVEDPRIVSGTYDASTGNSPAYAAATVSAAYPAGYDSERFRENDWVYDRMGVPVDGPYAVSGVPSGIDPAALFAPSENSRLVVVQLDPVLPNPRYNQTITLSTVINSH